MDTLKWESSRPLTLGVEVELQLIHSGTFDLCPSSIEIVGELNNPQVQPEIFQSMIEISTGICKDAFQVRDELGPLFAKLLTVAERRDILISGAGSHPFAHHVDRKLYPNPRYENLIKRNRWIARRLQIFGTHVHIGCPTGDAGIALMNGLTPWLPVFLALSSSSPFLYGETTELKASRVTLFESMPTSGHPCLVSNWQEFQTLYESMKQCGAIDSHKDLWWDIRPSPGYGTIEVRVCDGVSNLQELWSIVAFVHLVAASLTQHSSGTDRVPQAQWIVRENKWRAALHGVAAELVWTDGDSIPVGTLIEKFIYENKTIVQEFGYEDAVEHIRRIVLDGSSADRQIETYKSKGNLEAVVKQQTEEFRRFKP